MTPPQPTHLEAIEKAHQALQRGERVEARRWAQIAAALAPELEAPWLLMAAVSAPEASLHYLKRALEINPGSSRARKGMDWAIRRMRTAENQSAGQNIPIPQPQPPEVAPRSASKWIGFSFVGATLLILLLLVTGLAAWRVYPQLRDIGAVDVLASLPNLDSSAASLAPTASADNIAIANLDQPPTPTQVIEESGMATETPMQPLAPTPTFTNTPLPTNTPTPTATFTPTPTATYTLPPPPTEAPKEPVFQPPSSVRDNEHWIDIDLSEQRIYAYEGDQLVNSFRVSTGTWRTPTVLGRYRIYVKYRAQTMSGPGYYLPNVPYVMYFYKGYGIHGTFWHNNFGTPMSHGCVNMRTEEAAWMYKWSSIGTLVNVHR